MLGPALKIPGGSSFCGKTGVFAMKTFLKKVLA